MKRQGRQVGVVVSAFAGHMRIGCYDNRHDFLYLRVLLPAAYLLSPTPLAVTILD
jgi:hypothetical protein